jgi:thiol-disulfide isomerase/thioredoxin
MKKVYKISIYLILLIVVLIPGTREGAASILNSALLHSGILNSSTDTDEKELFDYDFVIKDLSGKEVDFKNFRGKVIFLNLWATWCGPCRSEMPSIEELYVSCSKEEIIFVMLSLDEIRRMDKVKSYIKDKNFSFPIYMANGQLTNQLHVDVIPTTFVIDKSGNIVVKETGMRNYNTDKFKRYLKSLATK